MKKRLIFNFYITDGWFDNHINKIHLECLKHYRDVFDELIFLVSVNDINDDKLIRDFEFRILDIGFSNNICFKVKQNHIFREAKNFYDEIACRLDFLDGATFFAHNKGITNYNNSLYNKEDVEKWITSMYYGCLERPYEMECFLTDMRKLAYGTLFDEIGYQGDVDMVFHKSLNLWLGKRRYFYMGTFFWMNCKLISYYLKNNNEHIPELNDRWYAENFFANIFDTEHISTFDDRKTINYVNGGVSGIDKIIEYSFGEEELKKYNFFHNKILNEL